MLLLSSFFNLFFRSYLRCCCCWSYVVRILCCNSNLELELVQYSRLYGIIYESPLRNVDFINYLHHTRRNIVIVISIRLERGGLCMFSGQRTRKDPMTAYIYIHRTTEFVHEITHLLNFAECTVIDGTISASNRKYCRCLMMATTFSASHRSCIETFYGHDHTKYIHKLLVPSVVYVVVVVVY